MFRFLFNFIIGCILLSFQVGNAFHSMTHCSRKDMARYVNKFVEEDGVVLSDDLKQLKEYVEDEILVPSLSRGLNVKKEEERESINDWICQMESLCPLKEPARNKRMGGRWIVDYTTAPPPSNGKLGPFVGVARQEIDLNSKTYVNYLSVPGDDLSKEWLSAKLVANYEEWDGTPLPDDRTNTNTHTHMDTQQQQQPNTSISDTSEIIDHGATSWKVNFDTLTIRLFGIPIISQNLSGKSRIWKMSYLDDHTRIVRAGRTGLDKDDMVFYMSRESS